MAEVVGGLDQHGQRAWDIWSKGNRKVTKSITWSSLAAAVLCVLWLCAGWFAFILIPLTVAVAAFIPWLVTQSIKRKLTRSAPDASGAVLKSPEELVDLSERFVVPFLSRNESQPGTPVREGEYVLYRHQSLDRATTVTVRPKELGMLGQLIGPLWASAHHARLILNSCALRSDFNLFCERLRHIQRGGDSTIHAYVSCSSDDATFLPFLQQFLAEEGEVKSRSELASLVERERHLQSLRGFAQDLVQRSEQSGFSISMEMVDAMEPYNFELLLGMIYEAKGYHVIETPKSGDQGADVLLERAGERVVVQAKLYSDSVGNKAVQEAIAARTHFRCHEAKVVTNNVFTSSAEDLARSSNVELIDRAVLVEMINEFNKSPKDYSRLATLMKTQSAS